MYTNESQLLAKISKKKQQLNNLEHEISEMEKNYRDQRNLRTELTEKFDDLQHSRSSNWDEFKKEYELVLDFAEGDKSSFIEAAESFIEELNKKITELEENLKKSSEEARKKSQEMLDDLNERKHALQERLEVVKTDTGELWLEVRQWFIERANSIKSMF